MLQAKTASNGHGGMAVQPRFVKKVATPPPRPDTAPTDNVAAILTPYGWVTVESITITPEIAEALLANRAQNRRPNPTHVSAIATAIRNNEFEFNGETVILDQAGKLIDGQHRCLAVMEAGKPIDVLMVRGIRNKAFATIDGTAQKRTGGHVLGMVGIRDPNTVAAAARLIEAYKHNRPIFDTNGFRPSPAYIHEKVSTVYGNMQPNIAAAYSVVSQLGGSKSYLTAIHWLLAEKDRQKADTFFNTLSHGEGLSSGDPVLALRNWLIAEQKSRTRADAGKRATFIAFVTAWNAYRTGRQLRRVSADPVTTPGII